MPTRQTNTQYTPEHYEEMLKLVERGHVDVLVNRGRVERSRAVHRFIQSVIARLRSGRDALPHGAAHA